MTMWIINVPDAIPGGFVGESSNLAVILNNFSVLSGENIGRNIEMLNSLTCWLSRTSFYFKNPKSSVFDDKNLVKNIKLRNLNFTRYSTFLNDETPRFQNAQYLPIVNSQSPIFPGMKTQTETNWSFERKIDHFATHDLVKSETIFIKVLVGPQWNAHILKHKNCPFWEKVVNKEKPKNDPRAIQKYSILEKFHSEISLFSENIQTWKHCRQTSNFEQKPRNSNQLNTTKTFQVLIFFLEFVAIKSKKHFDKKNRILSKLVLRRLRNFRS